MGSIVEDADTDTVVYVAVGKNAYKTQQLLHWTVKNFSGKEICLLHIHQPHSLNSFCEFLFIFIFSFFNVKTFYCYFMDIVVVF